MPLNLRARGEDGEKLAIPYLESHNYQVIECNATFQGGEIDIICQKNGLWRFVEVKYRTSTFFGYPEDSMTPGKIKTVLRAIEFYCLLHHIDCANARLDFLGILKFPNGEFEYRLIEDVN